MIRNGASTASVQVIALLLASLTVSLASARSQDQSEPAATTFSQEELEQIVAPIALHPDDVVAQILMASTYPLEVVQAQRWQQENANLKSDALADALEQQSWDPSVKSLVQFPEVLKMMSEKLDWTQKLGDAVLADQATVMAAIQTLRQRAQGAGNLQTTEQQEVIVQKETIIIQAADPQVIYVPTYNPTVVYGTWPYPAYPPYYYPPPSYYTPGAAAVGFMTGVAVGAAWGYAWGGCGWGRGDIDIDVYRNANFNNRIDRGRYGGGNRGGRNTWRHDPGHRQGARYRDNRTAEKFGQGTRGGRDSRSSQDFRGRRDGADGRGGDRGAGRTGDRSAGRTGDRSAGRTGDRSAGRTGDRSAGRTGDRSAGRTGDRSAGRTGDRGTARSGSRSSAFGSSGSRANRGTTNRNASRGRSSRGRSSAGGRSSGSRGGGGRRGGGRR
jgi:hypothetical protein